MANFVENGKGIKRENGRFGGESAWRADPDRRDDRRDAAAHRRRCQDAACTCDDRDDYAGLSEDCLDLSQFGSGRGVPFHTDDNRVVFIGGSRNSAVTPHQPETGFDAAYVQPEPIEPISSPAPEGTREFWTEDNRRIFVSA